LFKLSVFKKSKPYLLRQGFLNLAGVGLAPAGPRQSALSSPLVGADCRSSPLFKLSAFKKSKPYLLRQGFLILAGVGLEPTASGL